MTACLRLVGWTSVRGTRLLGSSLRVGVGLAPAAQQTASGAYPRRWGAGATGGAHADNTQARESRTAPAPDVVVMEGGCGEAASGVPVPTNATKRAAKMYKNMSVVDEFPVPPELNGTPLFTVLQKLRPKQFTSATAAKKACRKGTVLVAGKVGKTSEEVVEGATVQLLTRVRAAAGLEPEAAPVALQVAFEDPHFAAVIKPQGMATLKMGPVQGVTAAQCIKYALTQQSMPDVLRRPETVHRLDAETGGLLVCAKTRPALQALSAAFAARRVLKRYRAVLRGQLVGCARIHVPLSGKPSRTEIRCVRVVPSTRCGHVTVVDMWPISGRQHQLRRHAAMLGHPIVGDVKYWRTGVACAQRSQALGGVDWIEEGELEVSTGVWVDRGREAGGTDTGTGCGQEDGLFAGDGNGDEDEEDEQAEADDFVQGVCDGKNSKGGGAGTPLSGDGKSSCVTNREAASAADSGRDEGTGCKGGSVVEEAAVAVRPRGGTEASSGQAGITAGHSREQNGQTGAATKADVVQPACIESNLQAAAVSAGIDDQLPDGAALPQERDAACLESSGTRAFLQENTQGANPGGLDRGDVGTDGVCNGADEPAAKRARTQPGAHAGPRKALGCRVVEDKLCASDAKCGAAGTVRLGRCSQEESLAARMCLWKVECSLRHPVKGDIVNICMPDPDMFEEVLASHKPKG